MRAVHNIQLHNFIFMDKYFVCLNLQTLFTMIPKGTLGGSCTKEQRSQHRSHTSYFYSKKIPRDMMLRQRNERMTMNMDSYLKASH